MRRRFSRPSPALVISIVALVFAMTGTGIAARSALIDGKKIKNGSIAYKKLVKNALVPKGYRLLIVPEQAGRSSSRSARASGVALTSAARDDQYPASFTVLRCPDGSLTFEPKCPTSTVDRGASTAPVAPLVPGPPGPAGQPGTNGADGINASLPVANRVTIPGGTLTTVKFAQAIGTGTSFGTFAEAQMVTPNQPIKVSAVTAEIVKQGASPPAVVTVILYVNSSSAGQLASCSITIADATKCTFDGPVTIPAGSKIAWFVQTTGVGLTAWDAYDLSLGYQSQAG